MRKRLQEGVFHVYNISNYRTTIFLKPEDNIRFLECINNSAITHNTKILEFCLMPNHFHLQVESSSLSEFMRRALMDFSRYYNKSYQIHGKQFTKPFESAPKRNLNFIVENCFYILNNPVVAGICSKPNQYDWNSFHFHHNGKTELSKYIFVDTSALDMCYKDEHSLMSAIADYKVPVVDHRFSRDSTNPRITNPELISIIGKILDGRSIYDLDKTSIKKLILFLNQYTNATFKQIAMNVHEEYSFVRKVCGTDFSKYQISKDMTF